MKSLPMKKRRYRPSGKELGISAGILSALCSGAMSFTVHSTAGMLPVTEITLFRSLLSLVAVSPFIRSEVGELLSRRAAELWFRSSASAISILCFAWNLQHTSIGFASILFNIAPIVVLVLGLLTKAIPAGVKYVFAMGLVALGSGLCFFGAAITPNGIVWIVGLIGALAAGTSYTLLQRQTARWSTSAVIWPLSWMTILAALLMKKGPWVVPPGRMIPSILLICCFGLATQFLVTVSLRYAGLALGTAMVPSSIGISVLMDAAASQQVHYVQLLGVFLYLGGLIPLIIWRSSAKGNVVNRIPIFRRKAIQLEVSDRRDRDRELLPLTEGDWTIREFEGETDLAMQDIRKLRAICWSDVYSQGHSLEDGFDGRARHWVVIRDKQIVAAARFTKHDNLVDVPDSHLFHHLLPETFTFPIGYISRLVVHPMSRGCGLAATLDTLRRDAAIRAGCGSLIAVWNPTSGERRRQQLRSTGFESPDGEIPLVDGGFGSSYVYAKVL